VRSFDEFMEIVGLILNKRFLHFADFEKGLG
jgi:hypothetical protein